MHCEMDYIIIIQKYCLWQKETEFDEQGGPFQT